LLSVNVGFPTDTRSWRETPHTDISKDSVPGRAPEEGQRADLLLVALSDVETRSLRASGTVVQRRSLARLRLFSSRETTGARHRHRRQQDASTFSE